MARGRERERSIKHMLERVILAGKERESKQTQTTRINRERETLAGHGG